jgi:ATP-dependent phosphoenolpyruvate carboxykinase
VTRREAYLENVPQRGREPAFTADYGPRHARAVFPLRSVGAAPEAAVPELRLLVVLDPGDEMMPAVARISRAQLPGHFLLRERHDDLAERTGRHGNRLAALLESCTADVVVLNSATAGRDTPGAVRKGAAEIVASAARGELAWEPDPEMRCDVAASVAGMAPELAWPRRRCERLGLLGQYDEQLAALRAQRRAYLSEFVGLDPRIVASVT